MAPKFKVKVISNLKIFKNITIFSVVTLSFLLIFFSKTDYFIINSIKSFSSGVVNPITKYVSSVKTHFKTKPYQKKLDLFAKRENETCANLATARKKVAALYASDLCVLMRAYA